MLILGSWLVFHYKPYKILWDTKFGLALLTTVLGRLDYYDVSYIINSTEYGGKLLCEAMFKFLSSRGEDAPLLIFVPESLSVNLPDKSSSIDSLLRSPEIVRQKFHQQLLRLMPHINHNYLRIALTQSLGEYKSRDKTVTAVFENTVKNIVTSMFSQLLLSLNETGEKCLIVDISTGLNLYVTSLLEAVRGVLVYDKLSNLLQGGKGIDAKVAYAPPILEANQKVQVEFHQYDVKAFFELPIKEKNVNLNNLIRLSYTNQQRSSEEARRIYEKIQALRMYLGVGRQAYNAIKYNTPLVLFHDQISSKLRRFEEIGDFPGRICKLINILEERHRHVSKSNEMIKVTRNYRVDKDLYINLHFHLALLNSIYIFWKQRIEGREPELEYIRQTFSELYRNLRLGLNAKFLERDCNEISAIVNSYEGDLTHAKLLEEIKGEPEDHRTKPPAIKLSDPKRNFFAHSGFLFNITKASKRDGNILLSYDDDAFEKEVMSWIDNPEG